MTTWLVHDTRNSGFLTAALVARHLREDGSQWISVSGAHESEIPTYQSKFWTEGIQILMSRLKTGDQVYFCGVQLYLSKGREERRNTIDSLKKKLGDASCLRVLSHRWPDEYSEVSTPSVLVPFQSAWKPGPMSPIDRHLSDLIFLASHQQRTSLAHRDDLRLLDGFGQALAACYPGSGTDPAEGLLKTFLDDNLLGDAMKTWRNEKKGDSNIGNANPGGHELVKTFSIPWSKEKKHVQARLRDALVDAVRNDSNADSGHGIGIGFQESSDGQYEIYVLRGSDVVEDRPSLLWLLSDRGGDLPKTRADGWKVADESTLQLSSADYSGLPLDQLKSKLTTWAVDSVQITTGEAGAPGVLSRVLCEAGDEALRQLDLGQRYAARELRFVPEKTILRFGPGNRSPPDVIRRTLVLTLEVKKTAAAAFLMRGDGYVLQKLESLLEGVLLGMQKSTHPWLWSASLADRIRLNPVLGEIDASEMTLALDTHVTLLDKNFDRASRAGAAFVAAKSPGKVVAYRETEMIGPSVQYAEVAAALAEDLLHDKKEPDAPLEVLDLFSGSGYQAWLLRERLKSRVNIVCVDAAVSESQSLVSNARNIFWLQTKAEQFLGLGGQPILSRKYDLIILDPPHAALLSLLFGGLVDKLRERANNGTWLAIFQGHTSQSGREPALLNALAKFAGGYSTRKVIVDSEEIVVCGPTAGFDERLARLSKSL